MKRLILAALAASLALLSPTAHAHEPLWAENASTIGPKIWHVDVRSDWVQSGPLMSGSRKIANPRREREPSAG